MDEAHILYAAAPGNRSESDSDANRRSESKADIDGSKEPIRILFGKMDEAHILYRRVGGGGRNIRTLGSNKKNKGVSCRRNGRRHIIYRASSGHVSISRERKAIFVVKLEKNDNRHKTKDYEQTYRKTERT